MPNEPNLISKVEQSYAIVAYPVKAMTFDVHGLHLKFARVTRIPCHLGGGCAVFQVGT